MRDSPPIIFDEIVKRIFGLNLNNEQVWQILKDIKANFKNYHNKFNDGIVDIIKDHKNLRYLLYFFIFYWFINYSNIN